MAELYKIMQDLTVIYYTANIIPEKFARTVRTYLTKAIGDLPLIVIEQPKEVQRSHLQIYRNALQGAKQAKTKYIGIAEDDVLYSPEHFKFRPKDGKFAYDVGNWGVYTWTKPPVFSYKGRRNMYSLICERDLFIEAMEERFAMYPNDASVPIECWAEPGKYERQLGITVRETEEFYSNPPNIVFSHPAAFAYANLGHRKKLGEMRAIEIPYWGRIEDIVKLYE